MISLIFIIIVTGLSVTVSYFLSSEPTWMDYYKGGIVGFFLSGVILYAVNKKRRRKELEEDKRSKFYRAEK